MVVFTYESVLVNGTYRRYGPKSMCGVMSHVVGRFAPRETPDGRSK